MDLVTGEMVTNTKYFVAIDLASGYFQSNEFPAITRNCCIGHTESDGVAA
jgi:hypothetical protein